MSEAPDLKSSNIHERVSAVQHLGLHGDAGDVLTLLEMAKSDKSPGVRLGAASAATDILSRYRLPPADEGLPKRERQRILDGFRGLDPGINPSVLTVLGALGTSSCLSRLLIGLRDPRYDVRNGATVALLRYCISGAVAEDAASRDKIVAVLDDRRMRPDVLAEVSRICAICGWQDARPKIEGFLGREDQVAEAAEGALALLDDAAVSEGLLGLWRSDGLDAGEVNPTPRPVAWALVSPSGGLYGEEGALAAASFSIEAPDRWSVTRGGESATWSVRRMHLPGGDEPVPALQTDGRTWFRVDDKGAMQLAEQLTVSTTITVGVCEALTALLPTSLAGRRVAAQLLSATGQTEAAVEAMEELIGSRKKPGADLFFYLAELQRSAGRVEAADATLEDFLVRSKGRGALARRAKAILGQ